MLKLAPLLIPLCLVLTACEKASHEGSPQGQAAAGSSQSPEQPAYHPSMGDLMTMAVQPRHTKLGMAGQAKNWVYAGYEAKELENAFARVGRTIPTYRKNDIAKMFDGNVKGPLTDLETAITNQDSKAFDDAYGKLTAACNTCHQGLEHAEVVIMKPSGAAFPDQDFRPKPKDPSAG
jgi:hypothetical protein